MAVKIRVEHFSEGGCVLATEAKFHSNTGKCMEMIKKVVIEWAEMLEAGDYIVISEPMSPEKNSGPAIKAWLNSK